MDPLLVSAGAVLSECGRYRYTLTRQVGEQGPLFGFVGVNPSTADAEVDDATVRKWRGFVQRWGGRGFVVVNLFAWRATDVSALACPPDPIGPGNLAAIAAMVDSCDVLVPCWGSRLKMPRSLWPQIDRVRVQLLASGKPVMCFGHAKSGDPMHPLMLGYSTPLVSLVAATAGAA
ncbi:MAG TPA: DUF1643 domain-containing protein [Frateuria sp.]|uniref:DUF1643 domain-containing protein n=1 Tax=Frateuria sp. TaxID=2211372 RepID=UPI002D7ED407|nr:DUF1643 domain-containing protein [Frateuria sp.]HET6805656.1 DUF1643 domain-containing protein [Frateuria sp.]